MYISCTSTAYPLDMLCLCETLEHNLGLGFFKYCVLHVSVVTQTRDRHTRSLPTVAEPVSLLLASEIGFRTSCC